MPGNSREEAWKKATEAPTSPNRLPVSVIRGPDVTSTGHHPGTGLDFHGFHHGTGFAFLGAGNHADTSTRSGVKRVASVRCRANGGVLMRMLSESGPAPFRSWLFSTLALLFLAGCATTRLAEEDQPTTAAALDVG